jgi:hypothetical protein
MKCILDTDSKDFGGFGFSDDSVKHFTLHDPLCTRKENKGVASSLYLPARYCNGAEKSKINRKVLFVSPIKALTFASAI